MRLSEAERQRRSEQAERQHRDGSLGSRAVCSQGCREECEIEAAILSGLRRKSVALRVESAELALRAGMRGEALAVAEQKAQAEVISIPSVGESSDSRRLLSAIIK